MISLDNMLMLYSVKVAKPLTLYNSETPPESLIPKPNVYNTKEFIAIECETKNYGA